jgi:hypothetical protein
LAIDFPGWSIVFGVNCIGEPIAAMKACASGIAAGLAITLVPL